MKKNVTMASFCYLVSRIWEKNSMFLLQEGKKTPGLCCFLSAK